MRDGFYYFSPEGTPFYPGVHNLGSRDWVTDGRDVEPLLGEWSGAREWYSGGPPARLPLPVLVGDPLCIQDGEGPGLPIIPDRSAFCGRILPDACYLAEDELRAKTNVLDCVFAKFSADFINTAYTDLPTAEAAVAGYLGPLATVSSFPQPTPEIPAGVIATFGTTAVLWLTGTSNFQQLGVQALYFGTGPLDQGLYSASQLYEVAAFAIADALNAAGAGAATRVVLTGHSYGGAVCMVLAAKMLIANPGRQVELLTLGAPQPGDKRLIDFTAAVRQTHYANERDPVPYLPPRGLTFAALLPFIGPLLALIWPRFARPSPVKTITQDGQFIDLETDQLPDDLITVATIAIAAALDVPNFIAHKADWYGYYLCQACPCVPRPCVAPGAVVLNFDFRLQNLAFVHALTPSTENYVRKPLTFSAPAEWFALEAGFEQVRITSTVDAFGIYSDFTVSYFFRSGATIFARFDWTFTADEMFMGIDTTTLPVMFSLDVTDSVTSVGQLKIEPTLI